MFHCKAQNRRPWGSAVKDAVRKEIQVRCWQGGNALEDYTRMAASVIPWLDGQRERVLTARKHGRGGDARERPRQVGCRLSGRTPVLKAG